MMVWSHGRTRIGTDEGNACSSFFIFLRRIFLPNRILPTTLPPNVFLYLGGVWSICSLVGVGVEFCCRYVGLSWALETIYVNNR